ncbi:SHOCT domain-containing protein [Microbacterium sp. LRZ72]|uniref:SHOCT domain-containing protein n=1 Tax=Microbacterium sp. LRZ72 TaxID=2942481 RepID=UPI0029B0C5C7|nr:SHOCT domain-containing protein [Microbacterium sp. LRZ72]MDX2377626.1 SHOCT domain-containing protein [Microbacterium sp. LRZ72]
MGFFDGVRNSFNQGRIELEGVPYSMMYQAVINAAAQCRFSVQNADRDAGFVSLRANSEYRHWDGNLSVTVAKTPTGSVTTISGAVDGFSFIGTKTASRGDLALAQGKLDSAIRRVAADLKASAPRRRAAAMKPTSPTGREAEAPTLSQELSRLRALLDNGTLSQEEFEHAKKRTLGLP